MLPTHEFPDAWSRRLAIIAALLGSGVLAAAAWPAAERSSTQHVSSLTLLILPAAFWLTLRRPPERRPTAFAVHGADRSFVAGPLPNAPERVCMLVCAVVWAGWYRQEFGLGPYSATVAALLPLAAVLTVRDVVDEWRGRAVLSLHASGLRWRGRFGSVLVPWSALRRGAPVVAVSREGSLTLAIDRPDLLVRRGLIGHLRLMPAGAADVSAEFVAASVRHYVDHPEHRDGIGTAVEHERLRAVLR